MRRVLVTCLKFAGFMAACSGCRIFGSKWVGGDGGGRIYLRGVWSDGVGGPDRSLATFRAGVVRELRGVGVGVVVRDVLGGVRGACGAGGVH